MQHLQLKDEKILELKQKVIEEKATYASLHMNFQKVVTKEESEDEKVESSDDYDDEVDKKDRVIKQLKKKLKKSQAKDDLKIHTTPGIDFDTQFNSPRAKIEKIDGYNK